MSPEREERSRAKLYRLRLPDGKQKILHLKNRSHSSETKQA